MPSRSVQETFLIATMAVSLPWFIGIFIIAYLSYRIAYSLILWPLYYSPLRHLPTPPGADLLTGHLRTIFNDASAPQRKWVKQLGPVVRFFGFAGTEHLVLVQPENLHQVLVRDSLNYPRPDILRRALATILGYGLLAVAENEHRAMRKVMNPAFSLANLMSQVQMYYDSIDGLSEVLDEQLSTELYDGKVIPMHDWISKTTLDIICKAAFGYKPNSLRNPGDELAKAYRSLSSLQNGANLTVFALLALIPGMPKLLGSPWVYHHRHWIAYFSLPYRLIEGIHTVKAISARLLQEKVQDSATVPDNGEKCDIMSILVRANKANVENDSTTYSMSDEETMAQVLTFLAAGHETAASGLSWSLWLLANDFQIQNRLRAEVTPVLKGNPHPDYRILKELQWLDCVIMETLRIIPPIPFTERTANKTAYVGDILVPKGTRIHIPISVINTYKGIWGEDAEVFRPDRWLDLPKEYNQNYSFMTFIAGPHACIGKTMAIMEMKAILASLVVNFTFEPAYDGQVCKPAGVTMIPPDGLPLLVKRVK